MSEIDYSNGSLYSSLRIDPAAVPLQDALVVDQIEREGSIDMDYRGEEEDTLGDPPRGDRLAATPEARVASLDIAYLSLQEQLAAARAERNELL